MGMYWFRQECVWYQLQSSDYVIINLNLNAKNKFMANLGFNRQVAFAA